MRFSTTLCLATVASVASAQSIVQLLSNTSELSSLYSLLQGYPSLVSTLSNATNVTILAPNNAALSAASSALAAGNSSLPNFVPNLISYHVVNGTVYGSQFGSTPIFANTHLTNSTYANVTGGQVVEGQARNGSVLITSGLKSVAKVVSANNNFTGGVVHIIDSVLTVPVNISTTATDAGLTAFSGALRAASLTSALDGLKDVTVFAPSNAAFSAIGSALGNLSTSTLSSILTYHVINGTIAYSSSLGNVSIPTLNGGRVNITVTPAGTVYVNQARVINPDILVANGVVHVLDAVLNPNGTVGAGSNSSNAYPGASSVSSLGGLTTGLPSATTTIAALTSSVSNPASGYTTQQAPGGTATSALSSSTGGAVPMATAAVAGAMAIGGWAALALL